MYEYEYEMPSHEKERAATNFNYDYGVGEVFVGDVNGERIQFEWMGYTEDWRKNNPPKDEDRYIWGRNVETGEFLIYPYYFWWENFF